METSEPTLNPPLLLELRQKLLNQHQKYMRLMTDQEIKELTRENILRLMSCAHHKTSSTATTEELSLPLYKDQEHWQFGMIIQTYYNKDTSCLQYG